MATQSQPATDVLRSSQEYYALLARKRRTGAWVLAILLIFSTVAGGLALLHPHGLAGAARVLAHYYGLRVESAAEDDDATDEQSDPLLGGVSATGLAKR